MVRRKNKIYMPMGVGGLLSYPEEAESKIKIKPEHVIYFSIGVAILVAILRIFIV